MPINVDDWSETPASNTTIDAVNIGENCNPGGLNNMGRAIMSGVKTFKVAYDAAIAGLASYMPKAAGTFTGTQPIYTAEGAMLHNQNSAYTSGKIFVQATGGSAPTMNAGDWLAEY